MAIPNEQNNRKEQMIAFLGGAASEPVGAPRNRDEEWVLYLKAKAAGESATIPVGAPRNREEEWLMWLGDNIGGGSGENPNYIETITGTLGTLFDSIDFDAFAEQLSNNDITAYLALRSVTIGDAPFVGYVRDSNVFFSGGIASQFNTDDNYLLAATVVFAGGDFVAGLNELYSPQYSDYTTTGLTANMSATLTIIHHPLP